MTAPIQAESLPIQVEAMLFDGETSDLMDVYLWVESLTQGSFDPFEVAKSGSGVSIDPSNGRMLISTLRGVISPNIGEWVIHVANGQFIKLPHEIFATTHRTLDGTPFPEPRPQTDPEPSEPPLEENSDVPPPQE